jgi:hypothetical protein
MGVFHLAETEFGIALGSISGDDVWGGPVVAVGDQDAFAEDLVFEGVTGLRVDVPGQAEGGRGITGEGVGEDLAHVLFVHDLVEGGFELGSGASGAATGEGVGDLGQFAAYRGQGLGQAARLAGVQLDGVGEYAAVGAAQRGDADLDGLQPAELLQGLVARPGQGQQVGLIRRWHRPDVVQALAGQLGEVGLGVLPGVEDHGQLAALAAEAVVPPHQLGDHGGELGDVVAVARIGVGEQRNPPIAGDYQTQTDQT